MSATDRDDQIDAALRVGIAVLEERAQCIAGCGCWEDMEWDDPAAISELAAARGDEWRASVIGALSLLEGLDDTETEHWAVRLGGDLHATVIGKREDPRTFFGRVLAALRG